MEFVISVTGDPVSALGALQAVMKDDDTFIAVAAGSEKLDGLLDICISAGASRTYRLMDEDFKGSDTWALARIYAAFVGKYSPEMEIMIFSRYSSVLPMLAHLIGVQQFCYVTEIGRDAEGIFVTQDYGDERRKCRVPRGSVISLKEDADFSYEDRSSSISKIEIVDREGLELAKMSVGFPGSRVFAREVC
ncbi:MAG: hypothetical protein AB7D42_01335 [Candidatus Methanomethylophilaceae archaeon]|nr:hypothetical protein [Candidatus Methanomethylophilaceae archaeon]